MTIKETIRIALDAHACQKDLVGNPAILHLMSVCVAGKTDLQKKAGILHDIIEDTDMTLDNLRARGVEEDVVAAVDLLTHREEDSYEDYIRKIASGNETAFMSNCTTSITTFCGPRMSFGGSTRTVRRRLTCLT